MIAENVFHRVPNHLDFGENRQTNLDLLFMLKTTTPPILRTVSLLNFVHNTYPDQ